MTIVYVRTVVRTVRTVRTGEDSTVLTFVLKICINFIELTAHEDNEDSFF